MSAYSASNKSGRAATGQVQTDHADETPSLISSRKVIGTSVYNANGDDLGTIHDIMLEKHSGRVAYAVMSFGGFLGIGEKYHTLPWNVLTYDEDKRGYNIDLSEEQLRNAPAFSEDELEDFGARDYGRVSEYYDGLGYPADRGFL
jgi:sporulation protein YlmC with PRC-barrel domain